MVTIKQKVWLIYFRREKIKIFCTWKERMVEHQIDFLFMQQHDGGSVSAELGI